MDGPCLRRTDRNRPSYALFLNDQSVFHRGVNFFSVVHSLREWFPALAERVQHFGGVTPA
jgi:hypothetical protein